MPSSAPPEQQQQPPQPAYHSPSMPPGPPQAYYGSPVPPGQPPMPVPPPPHGAFSNQLPYMQPPAHMPAPPMGMPPMHGTVRKAEENVESPDQKRARVEDGTPAEGEAEGPAVSWLCFSPLINVSCHLTILLPLAYYFHQYCNAHLTRKARMESQWPDIISHWLTT